MKTRIVVMGVSGCGKTTLGAALAEQFELPFIEGDHLHSPQSVLKMSSGVPLEDADRWPWLDRVGVAMLHADGAVASCSALRRAYRDRIRATVGADLRFVMVDLPYAALLARMNQRTGHYMPPALLDSQLQTLERPDDEPDVLVIDGTDAIDMSVAAVERWCAASKPVMAPSN